MCYTRNYSPLLSDSTGTQFPAVCILNMYAVHDINGLDAYTLYTVHEQDSMVVRHKRTMPYTAHNVIHTYIVSMYSRVSCKIS